MIQILVVEDERIIATNLKENLESLGYAVPAIAASGEKAVEKATQLRPDLVLMDIRLKGDMDGIEAAQQIWKYLSIPVIYLTGHSDQITLERAKVSSPFGYILKPIKDRELSVAIEIALQRYEREQLLTAILREMDNGVIVVDKQCRIQFLNRAAETLTGWQQNEAKERELTEVFQIVDQQTQQPVDDPVQAAFEQDTTVYLKDHTILISKNGSVIPIEDSAAPIKDSKGELTGGVLVFQDNTNSVQLDKAKLALEQAFDELKRAQSQLIQSEKMSSIGRMVTAVVNEFNNPITLIYGNIPLARSYFQDLLSLIQCYKQSISNSTPEIQHLTEKIDLDFLVEDWSKIIDSIQFGAERILEIILSLQSLRSGSRLDKIELQYVNIHEGIEDALQLLQHRLRAEGKRPVIQVNKDYGQLPLVSCYVHQLNQVFMHLLNNAIDALENQPEPRIITIRTQLANGEPGMKRQGRIYPNPKSKSVIIQIADNGSGISNKNLSHIFDPFFTTKPAGYSTGLGLSISYQIVVDRHGGKLTCNSTLNQGTEFTISVPIVQQTLPTDQ